MVARRIPVPKVAGSIPVPFRDSIFGDRWKKYSVSLQCSGLHLCGKSIKRGTNWLVPL